jgi:hypothetical protein
MLKDTVRVEYFGNVKNQFIIYTKEGQYLQSYNSIIAFRNNNREIFLDNNYWDYSQTTGRYRNLFLRETKKETENKIKNGEYILTDLNK